MKIPTMFVLVIFFFLVYGNSRKRTKIPYKSRDINKERNVLLTRPDHRLYIHGLVASTEMNSILCFTFFLGLVKKK